jgi:RNA recognition motif-containing protein
MQLFIEGDDMICKGFDEPKLRFMRHSTADDAAAALLDQMRYGTKKDGNIKNKITGQSVNFLLLYKLPRMKLFVAGLPYDLDDAELMEIFEKFGTVTSAKVAMDKETGKSKGFGFVEMPDAVEGKDAIESMNDISLGKKPLVVKEAEENRKPQGPPSGGFRPGGNRSGGGGFNRPNDRGGNRY